MKLFTLLLAAAITAMPAMAAHKKGEATSPFKMATTKSHTTKGVEFNQRALDLTKLKPVQQPINSRADEPILEVEGEATTYAVEATGIMFLMGYTFVGPTTVQKDIVWGDNGEVYIKNFVDIIGIDYYIKGELADSKITIDFPQAILYDEWEGNTHYYYLNLLEFDENAQYTYKNVEDDQNHLVIDMAEDGTFSFDLNPGYDYRDFNEGEVFPQYLIGMVDDTEAGSSSWFGFGDYAQSYSVFDYVANTLPENVEPENWILKYTNFYGDEYMGLAKVAFDGEDIYIGSFLEALPDAWAKGSLDGDKAYFESGQYLGYLRLYSTPIFFVTGTTFELNDDVYIDVEFNGGITFTYDAEAKTLIAEEGKCFILNCNLEMLYYLEAFFDAEFFVQDPALTNAAPLDPEFLSYQEWDPDYYGRQGGIVWNIPAVNVNGVLLDTEKMYYHFLVDGEIYPLDPEEYLYVEESMTDIPYNYTDDRGDIFASGEEHDIYFYFNGALSFGIQSFYVGDDGVTYASNIVTYYPETDDVVTGIAAVAADTVSTKCYDITGREVVAPKSGIVIKVSKLSDGSIRTEKVIIK